MALAAMVAAAGVTVGGGGVQPQQAQASTGVYNTAWVCGPFDQGKVWVCTRVQYMKDTAYPGMRKPIHVQAQWSPASYAVNADNVQTLAGSNWYLIGDNLPNGAWSDWAWRTPYTGATICGVRLTLDGAQDFTLTQYHSCRP